MSRAMRGYFGIGVESISKPMNVGNLIRSAHAFGADFFFAIANVKHRGRPRPMLKASPTAMVRKMGVLVPDVSH